MAVCMRQDLPHKGSSAAAPLPTTPRTTAASIPKPPSAWSFKEGWEIRLELSLCSWQFLWFNSEFYYQLAYPSQGKVSRHTLTIFRCVSGEETDAVWFFVKVCAETQGVLLPYRIRDRERKVSLFKGEGNGAMLVGHFNRVIIIHLLETWSKDIVFWFVGMRPRISLRCD